MAAPSPRQFSRAETGQTPAKAAEQLRLRAARLVLDHTRDSVEAVARETGFVDLRPMREAFVRHHGQPPQAMRRMIPAAQGDRHQSMRCSRSIAGGSASSSSKRAARLVKAGPRAWTSSAA